MTHPSFAACLPIHATNHCCALTIGRVWQRLGPFGRTQTIAGGCRCFARLESPPVRVCGYDTPFPLVYEPIYLPSAGKVAAAIRKAVKY